MYTFKSTCVHLALLTSVASGMRLPFEATLVGYELGTKGYQLPDNHTHSHLDSCGMRLRREQFFLSLQGTKPCPAPTSPAPKARKPPIYSPALAAPNPPAAPPTHLARAPSGSVKTLYFVHISNS